MRVFAISFNLIVLAALGPRSERRGLSCARLEIDRIDQYSSDEFGHAVEQVLEIINTEANGPGWAHS